MRFRANIEHVNTFYKISQAVEKLQKRCIIKFTESEMHIICNNEAGEGGIQVWSQIKVSSLFTDYRIQSNANNEIYLGLPTEAMTSALKSAAAPTGQQAAFSADAEVVMKLMKKNDVAVLTFEIATTTRMGRYVRIAHDVRIEVLKPQDVSRIKEPMCPEPEVHILLPPLAKLRTVVERMRPLAADVIGIRANLSGCLQLCAQTDNARVDVSWNGLSNPKMAQDPSTQDPDNLEARDPTTLYGVLVSLKSLQKFLSSHVVSTTTIACICQNHCIILYVYIGEMAEAGGVLTFYIPAIIE
ncbi:cell cycle checkpoint [Rhodofomes roseus]|uniref:Checkpoint protein n=1 Tax=Rhodofomes roseus TaxID=34475 RepID=A0ABQ8KKP9_9APHY|nr:cell cycle checkpoint [Rhodofomes roseus]KAH9838729.1 cell cycle checkpoint [Rhodofomes roseus]